jgi:hypothetical protein
LWWTKLHYELCLQNVFNTIKNRETKVNHFETFRFGNGDCIYHCCGVPQFVLVAEVAIFICLLLILSLSRSADLSTDPGLKLHWLLEYVQSWCLHPLQPYFFFFYSFWNMCSLIVIHQIRHSSSERSISFAPISDQITISCAERVASSTRTVF